MSEVILIIPDFTVLYISKHLSGSRDHDIIAVEPGAGTCTCSRPVFCQGCGLGGKTEQTTGSICSVFVVMLRCTFTIACIVHTCNW